MRTRIVVALLVMATTACSNQDGAKAVEGIVRRSITAESARSTSAFLALWTDKGLKSYDLGTREAVKSGMSENFGADRIDIVKISDTTVTGDTATTTVDAVRGQNHIVKPRFRVRFKLAKTDGKWLIDGFRFVGGPPLGKSATVVDVKATEYAFALKVADVPVNVAFRFSNRGKEQHELKLFKAPDGVDLATAKKSLERVNGAALPPGSNPLRAHLMTDAPADYQADHLSFAAPGESFGVSFAEPLVAGTYVLACYVPQGGFNRQGQRSNPDGLPHVQLGMISMLTVR